MAGWQTIKLSDVVRTNVSTYSLSDNWEFVNYLDTGNIVANEIALIQRIELAQGEKLPSRARRKVEIGDIIYSTVRPNQLHYGFIDNIPENFLVSTGFAVLHPEKGKIDAKFLYYLLVQNDITEKLQAIAEQSTSTYPSIKPSDIEDLDFIVPEIKAQRKISNILSAIDKKIELNTQINHNLEEQAKAIFKSWFVDFEPFNGKMPKSWLAKTLADVSKIGAGGDKPHCVSEIQTPEFQYPIYSNGLANDGLYGYASSAKIYEESITVSARGTIGFVCLRQEPYVPIVRLITLIPNTCFVSAKYLYLYLKGINISGTGTTQQQLTVPDFQKTSIMVPDNDTMKRFTICADSIFEQIKHNAKEMRTLAQLRDTLLPKLMSGEIDVSEVEV